MALQVTTGRNKSVLVAHPSHWGDIHTAGSLLWTAGYSMRKWEVETAHLTGINAAIAGKIMDELSWRADDEAV